MILRCVFFFPVMKEYLVVGRRQPGKSEGANPLCYRINIFAENEVSAKSRFWYFLSKLRKLKKADGEILSVTEIYEKRPNQVKCFGIWLTYNSRSGTHNMYKEIRALKKTEAIDQLYSDMASRHRARYSSIRVRNTAIIKAKDCRRWNIQQMHDKNISFPLCHRIQRASSTKYKATFRASRPSTFR